jgi:hypothetical protein
MSHMSLCGLAGKGRHRDRRAFQWARVTSPVPLVTNEDPLYAWFQRCLDLYDGLGRREPGYDW